MGLKRFLEIEFEPDWNFSPNELKDILEKKILWPEHSNTTSCFRRGMDVYRIFELLSLQHFQLVNLINAASTLRDGCKCAVSYFWDDNGPGCPIHCRKNKGRRVDWYHQLSRGLLMCLLDDSDGENTERLAEWVWPELQPEYAGMGGELEDEVAFLLIIIASNLAKRDSASIQKLVKKVGKSRTKRPRLLLNAWDAVMLKSNAEFSSALIESLDYFSTIAVANSDKRIGVRIAIPQSIIYHVAIRFGLVRPKIPSALSPFLMTHETLGLSE